MSFLDYQRKDNGVLQFLLKKKSKEELDDKIADCEKQGAFIVRQGVHRDDGYVIYWALMEQLPRTPGER